MSSLLEDIYVVRKNPIYDSTASFPYTEFILLWLQYRRLVLRLLLLS